MTPILRQEIESLLQELSRAASAGGPYSSDAVRIRADIMRIIDAIGAPTW